LKENILTMEEDEFPQEWYIAKKKKDKLSQKSRSF
jgi:hypothetical protein